MSSVDTLDAKIQLPRNKYKKIAKRIKKMWVITETKYSKLGTIIAKILAKRITLHTGKQVGF